jgi:hypothetical protein
MAFYCREHLAERSLKSREARRVNPRVQRLAPKDLAVPDGHKWCPDCQRVLPLDDFVRTVRTASGRHAYCRSCHNVRSRASREKAGGARTYHLTRRYGISAEEADLMLAEQDGLCAICQTAAAVHVDHDHESGAVRSLLCFNCNGGLGQFRDDPVVLRAAADYVEEHRGRSLTAASARGTSAAGHRTDTHPSTQPSASRAVVRWRAMFPDWDG